MHTSLHSLGRALGRAYAHETVRNRVIKAVAIGLGVACLVARIAPAQGLIWGAIALSWTLIWQARQELDRKLRSHDQQIIQLTRMCESLYRRHKQLERSVANPTETHTRKHAPVTSNPAPPPATLRLDDPQQHLLERLLTRPVELRE